MRGIASADKRQLPPPLDQLLRWGLHNIPAPLAVSLLLLGAADATIETINNYQAQLNATDRPKNVRGIETFELGAPSTTSALASPDQKKVARPEHNSNTEEQKKTEAVIASFRFVDNPENKAYWGTEDSRGPGRYLNPTEYRERLHKGIAVIRTLGISWENINLLISGTNFKLNINGQGFNWWLGPKDVSLNAAIITEGFDVHEAIGHALFQVEPDNIEDLWQDRIAHILREAFAQSISNMVTKTNPRTFTCAERQPDLEMPNFDYNRGADYLGALEGQSLPNLRKNMSDVYAQWVREHNNSSMPLSYLTSSLSAIYESDGYTYSATDIEDFLRDTTKYACFDPSVPNVPPQIQYPLKPAKGGKQGARLLPHPNKKGIVT